MIDAEFLAGLRAVAEQSAEALEYRASLARDADRYQSAEVADIASNGFRALAELAGKRLATGRARLLAGAAAAEARLAPATAGADESERDLAGSRPGADRAVAERQRAAWDREEDAALRALGDARRALAAFDAATKAGQ